ncbi:aerobic carbon monoxide dehydrogenase, ATPase accessory protein coxD [Burkholderiales bacterium]|nr:aerobic carbon monoxide dehydrogenase, ATPase accessory protein coxD [Burkholderiales bacterium]
MRVFADTDELVNRLEHAGYITEQGLAVSLMLMSQLQRPLLVEGDAGVGKTEIAKALAAAYECELIRLQCYEGLDVNAAVYEWNYQRQLLAIKLQETEKSSLAEKERHVFSEGYLLQRPLLQAISRPQPPVLLIDEVDRADEEFEAYLLEVLSDYQISIPELGTIKATSIPHVVLTSNGTRELSDALRRRCLYFYLDYPSYDKELRIVLARVPQIEERLAGQIVAFVQKLRGEDLQKRPGTAETLDWAAALVKMRIRSLDTNPDFLAQTLVCLLKTREDRAAMPPSVTARLLAQSV